MKRFELIGTSGVGKSTIYKMLECLPFEERNYFTLRDLLREAAISHKVPIFRVRKYLLQKLLKYNCFQGKEKGICNKILYEASETIVATYCCHADYSVSLNVLYHSLLNEKDPFFRLYKMRRFMDCIELNETMSKCCSEEDPVVLEENLLHWHCGITDYAMNQYTLDNLFRDKAFNVAGIIHCEQSPEVICDQVLQRQRDGAYRSKYDSMGRAELKKYIEGSVKHFQKQARIFKEMGIPVISINTGIEMREISKSIRDLVRSVA